MLSLFGTLFLCIPKAQLVYKHTTYLYILDKYLTEIIEKLMDLLSQQCYLSLIYIRFHSRSTKYTLTLFVSFFYPFFSNIAHCTLTKVRIVMKNNCNEKFYA